MTIRKFIFIVVNLNYPIYPLYKATCINGYGQGYGVTVEDAIEVCRKQIVNMVEICTEVNITMELISKETFKQKANVEDYCVKSWDDVNVSWIEFDISELNAGS